MTRQLHQSLVRVWNRDGGVVGAGFLVGEREFLTCAHVVALALNQPQGASPPTDEVLVDFPQLGEEPTRIPAVVACWSPEKATGKGDIAGLVLQQAAPPGAQPLVLVSAEEPWGHEFRTFGFPGGEPRGAWASGVLRDVEGTGWLQIEDVKLTGRRIRPGFSGAPVWVDEPVRGVVGMVVAADRHDGDRVAYAIPSALLLKAWPDVLGQRTVAACPYRGLLAFRERDAQFFFGREEEVSRLVTIVRRQPLVAVLGPSGSGKSSVVFAGLMPQLRSDSGLLTASFHPGPDPFAAVATALLPLLDPDLGEASRLKESDVLAGMLRRDQLARVVERILDKTGARQVVLVADQFEELYTLCASADERHAFLDTLVLGSIARRNALVVVLTMRADFYERSLEHRALAEALEQPHLNLGAMTREQLRHVIEEPARHHGVAFADGLVDRILSDVGDGAGRLPLLEFALTLLWERQRNGLLHHSVYDSIGRVKGALTKYAEEVYQSLSEAEQTRVRRVFGQLIAISDNVEDARRVAVRGDMPAEDWAIVQRLADERLVVTNRDLASNEKATAQVAHEALIQGWERLRAWVAADRAFLLWREQVRAAMRLWEASDRDAGDLLRGIRLSEAVRWCSERAGEVNELILEFVRESRRGEAEDWMARGGNYIHRGRLDDAIPCYEEASSIYRELGESTACLEALRVLIELHLASDEPGRCMSRYRETLELLGPEVGSNETTEMLLRLISAKPDALRWYRLVLAIHRQIADRHGEARIRLLLANRYLMKRDLDRALRYAAPTPRIYEQLGERDKVEMLLHDFLDVHAYRGEGINAFQRHRELVQLSPPDGWRERLYSTGSLGIHLGVGLWWWSLLYILSLIPYAMLAAKPTLFGITIGVGGRWVTRMAIAVGAALLAWIVGGNWMRVLLAFVAILAIGEGWLWLLDLSEHGFVLGVVSAFLLGRLILSRRWPLIRPYTRVLRIVARWIRHTTVDFFIVLFHDDFSPFSVESPPILAPVRRSGNTHPATDSDRQQRRSPPVSDQAGGGAPS